MGIFKNFNLRSKKHVVKDEKTFDFPSPKAKPIIEEKTLQETLSNGLYENLFEGLSFVMPNPDPVLKKMGKDIDAYNELLSDPQLYGAIENNRKPGTMSLLMYLDNPNCPKQEMEFFQQYFEQMKNDDVFYNNMNKALDTPFFGRMVFGTRWDFVNNYFVPVEITTMPHRLCKFDYDGRFLISKDGVNFNPPEHPAKYITLRHKPTLENPYGEALLSRCYWNIRFKKDGFKLWAMFTEKYGMPWIKSAYDPIQLAKAFPGSTQGAAQQLLDSLSAMAKDGILVHPNAASVEAMETGKTSNADIYERLVRICDEQNTKLILGHSGATESTSGDKLSNDTTATDVRQHIIESDKKFPIILFNQLIYWIHQFNFSGTELPRFDLYAEEDIDMSIATRDAALVPVLQLSGQKFSKQYFMDNYGFAEGELEDAPASPNNAVAGKKDANSQRALNSQIFDANYVLEFMNLKEEKPTSDQLLIDDKADASAGDTEATNVMLDTVVQYLNKQTNFEQAIGALAKLFPKMETKDLQSKLEQMMFVADIAGRLSVNDELEQKD